jgi:HlyD family secretion protein
VNKLSKTQIAMALIIAAVTATAMTATGCVDRKAQEEAKKTGEIVSNPAVSVQTAALETRPLRETTEITGQIVTGDQSVIGAKNTGRLVSVLIKDGSAVTTGQVLATQDTSQLQAQLQQAYAQVQSAQSTLAQALRNLAVNPLRTSAAVAQAQAQVRHARANYQKALNGPRGQERAQAESNVRSTQTNWETQKKELERISTLVNAGAIAANRLDQQANATRSAESSYQSAVQALSIIKEGSRREDIVAARESVAQAEQGLKTALANKELDSTYQDQVNGARAQVASAQANVRVIQQQIDDATIRAPFSGVISGRPAQVGTVLGTGAALATLVGGDATYFEGQVPEQLVDLLRPGSVLQVKIPAIKQETTGTVVSVNPIGSNLSRQFSTRIALGLPMSMVRPGMFGTGVITLRTVPSAIVAPVTAVVNRDEKQVVFTVEGGKAKAQPVVTGLKVGNVVQITGVAPGTKIVVRGMEGLDDGSAVKEDSGAAATTGSKAG